MPLKLRSILTALIFIIATDAFSQGQGRSPYSSFGPGDLTDDTNGAQDMMGGTGVSFTNTFYINDLNPALLSKGRVINGLKYVALNVSGKGSYKQLEQGTKQTDDFGLNLSNLSLAFPILSKWTTGVNFKPYTILDNENVTNTHFEGSSSIASYKFTHFGGISKIGFTNSVQPVKGLYLGVEGQYFFGALNTDTTINLLGASEYNRYKTRESLSGYSLKSGVAYQQKLNKNWFVNVGGVYQRGTDLKGENIRVFQTLSESSVGLSEVGLPDTLSMGNITSSLPNKYKVGLSLEKTYNWLFAAEYGMTDWESISNPHNATAKKIFRNSREMNFGLEWIPDVSSNNYFNQVFYRIGYKAVETPYFLNDTRIKDNSFTFGLSLPMGRGTNYLDLGAAIGKRGTTLNNLVAEKYVRISVSFSMTRDWFHRPIIN